MTYFMPPIDISILKILQILARSILLFTDCTGLEPTLRMAPIISLEGSYAGTRYNFYGRNMSPVYILEAGVEDMSVMEL